MKKVKVNWTEREVIEYGYEEVIEVEDDFVINSEYLGNRIQAEIDKDCITFDNKYTNYEPVAYFQDPETGKIEIKEFEVNLYEEILPPSPEEKKAEYLQLLAEMDEKIAGMTLEKERILKLVNQNES